MIAVSFAEVDTFLKPRFQIFKSGYTDIFLFRHFPLMVRNFSRGMIFLCLRFFDSGKAQLVFHQCVPAEYPSPHPAKKMRGTFQSLRPALFSSSSLQDSLVSSGFFSIFLLKTLAFSFKRGLEAMRGITTPRMPSTHFSPLVPIFIGKTFKCANDPPRRSEPLSLFPTFPGNANLFFVGVT